MYARGADRNVQSSARNPSRTPHSQRGHLKERRSDPGNTQVRDILTPNFSLFFQEGAVRVKIHCTRFAGYSKLRDRINATRSLRIMVQNARAPMQVGTHLEQTIQGFGNCADKPDQ